MTDSQVRSAHVAVIVAVHNRVAHTLSCLKTLAAQRPAASVRVYVFDDGSTDGTAEQVAEKHPDTVLLRGDGSFYWNGGMRVAFAAAIRDEPDFVMWLNDDTTLAADALATLLATEERLRAHGRPPLIVVGAVADPDAGGLTYSGVRQHPRRRLRFDLIEPGPEPKRADTMNGNCVLIPRTVIERIGNLDPGYTHSMGDYDYGLRARRAGCEVWVAPGVLGSCAANPGFVPAGGGVRSELARLRGTKHLPPDEWWRFARRWGGPAWPLLWAFPYVRRLGWIIRGRAGAGTAMRPGGPTSGSPPPSSSG